MGHASLEPGGSDSLGPDGQSSSADAAIKTFVTVEELCLDLSLFLAGSCS